MKRCRQITAALLALLLLLAGCGKQQQEDSVPDAPDVSEVIQNMTPFQNPIAPHDAPDPFITYDGDTGYYYVVFTQGDRVEICRSRHLATLFTAGDTHVAYRVDGQKYGIWGDVWAPEMHKIGNTWYIYTSGRSEENGGYLRLFALKSKTADPFDGWTFSRILSTGASAIDPTVYTAADGKLYLCCSRATDTDGSVLEITRMTSAAWCASESAIIAKNELAWELVAPAEQAASVMEAPFFLEHGGRLFIIYSVNHCFSDAYALGVLEYLGGDLCDPASWQKHPEPLLTAGNGIYGPGHASFFASPDGTEIFASYHGMKQHKEDLSWAPRYPYVQRVAFDETGYPVLGKPVGEGVDILPPSGEPA